jgi:antitoxin VapB
MKTPRATRRKRATSKQTSVKFTSTSRRASIFRNGANQAVRLPQELRFPEDVKEVRIRKQGGSLLISPIRPDWASFFSREVDVPDNFLESRDDSPPQSREPL